MIKMKKNLAGLMLILLSSFTTSYSQQNHKVIKQTVKTKLGQDTLVSFVFTTENHWNYISTKSTLADSLIREVNISTSFINECQSNLGESLLVVDSLVSTQSSLIKNLTSSKLLIDNLNTARQAEVEKLNAKIALEKKRKNRWRMIALPFVTYTILKIYTFFN